MLAGLIDEHIEGSLEQKMTVIAALQEREDNALDMLRAAAAGQGLRPSITQVILSQTGLGTPMTPEAFALVQAQAEVEIAELQELFRRMEGGDTG